MRTGTNRKKGVLEPRSTEHGAVCKGRSGISPHQAGTGDHRSAWLPSDRSGNTSEACRPVPIYRIVFRHVSPSPMSILMFPNDMPIRRVFAERIFELKGRGRQTMTSVLPSPLKSPVKIGPSEPQPPSHSPVTNPEPVDRANELTANLCCDQSRETCKSFLARTSIPCRRARRRVNGGRITNLPGFPRKWLYLPVEMGNWIV